MGLFGGNWAAPGPGVEKDAPKKKGIFLYFELFFRKFWKILHVNVIYFTASILFVVFLYLFAPIPTTLVDNMAQTMLSTIENLQESEVSSTLMSITANLQVGLRSMFAVTLFCLWGCAPMAAGYSYVTKCFAAEQHTWVWSDFVDKVKENFKQSIVVLGIDLLIFIMSCIAIPFYLLSYMSTGNNITLLICSMLGMMLFVYTLMHYYIYQIMITFECTLKQLYKNALLMAIARLPMNILLTLIALVLNYVIFIYLSPAVAIALSFFLWVSVVRFPIEFYTSRVIKKTIIDAAEKKSKKEV